MDDVDDDLDTQTGHTSERVSSEEGVEMRFMEDQSQASIQVGIDKLMLIGPQSFGNG